MTEADSSDYARLHAVVVDAIRYVTSGQSISDAADEVLAKLRTAGIAIPPK